MSSSSTDWLILRPLLVVAIVWATIVVGLIVDWIRKLMTTRKRRDFTDPMFDQLGPAGAQVTRGEIDSGPAPARSSANDSESRAA